MEPQNTLSDQYGLERRLWLTRTINVLMSLVAGTMVGSTGTYLAGTPEAKRSQDDWNDAGDVGELRANIPVEVKFEKNRVDGWEVRKEDSTAWVVLDNRGSLTAFSPQCTHLGCAYHWESKEAVFVCPCHGSKFGLKGQVLAGPATRPLDRLAAKLETNRLWLKGAPSESNPT
jgi:menaquinol-cytochrome c reductase iron-sulfur subunit